MALRRPTLLVCVVTIVLGINYEIGRPSLPESCPGFSAVHTPPYAVSTGPAARSAAPARRSRHTASDFDASGQCAPAFRSLHHTVHGKAARNNDDASLERKTRRRRRYHKVQRGYCHEDLPEERNRTRSSTIILPILCPAGKLPRYPESGYASSHQSQPTLFSSTKGYLRWSKNKLTTQQLSRSSDTHNIHSASPRLLLSSPVTSAKNDSHVSQDIKHLSEDGSRKTDISDSHSDSQNCLSGTHTAALNDECQRHHAHDEIPQRKPSESSPGSDDVVLLLDELQQLQVNDPYHFSCKVNPLPLEDENVNFSANTQAFHEISIMRAWKNCKGHVTKETKSRHEHNLSLFCLCITLLFFRNEDLRQMIAPLLQTFKDTNNIRELIEGFLQRITESSVSKGSSFQHDLGTPATNGPTDDLQKDKAHSLPNNSSGHFPQFLSERWQRPHKPVVKEGRAEKTTPFRASWLMDFTALIPRRPVTYTVFPASFLPSLGSSPKDSMSFVGCRLASLVSLPASCKVSRARLAQAGFYYDSGKTQRDSTNLHEVTCYSCGISYSEWKEGDNPDTIHQQLRPDCHHLKESRSSNSGSDSSSMSSNGSTSMASSNATSGYWSMNSRSLDSLRSMSSGHTSSADNSSQTSVPDGQLGSSTATGSRQSSPPRRDGAVSSYNSNDLATDCAAIAPSAVTSAPPFTNQAATSRPARDTVAVQPSNQSSLHESGYLRSMRAQALDDRPPVSMEDAVYPQFSRMQDRRVTFSAWPLSHVFHPDQLVMQGFYYAGYADCIRCFYCGVGLKSWCQDDDVMVEHIRWRPSCGYILNTKGRHFVNSVIQRIQASSSELQNSGTSQQSQGGTETTTVTTTARQTAPAMSTATTVPSTTPSTAAASSPTTNARAGSGTTAPNTTTTTTSASAPGNPASAASSTAASAPSSASLAAVPGGDRNATAGSELLRRVEEMGFDRPTVARAVRQLQQEGVTAIDVDTLVEKLCDMGIDGDEESGRDAAAHSRDLQTDGPEEDANSGADSERAQWLASENERLRERNRCKICKEAKVGMIFLPCGHIVACTGCGNRIRNCSMCGEFIKATANVYI